MSFSVEPEVYFQAEDRKRSGLEPHHIVQLISAVLNATVVIILSWQKATSLVVKVLFWMAALTLLGIVVRYTVRGGRWLWRTMRTRKVIAAEQIELEQIFNRFRALTSDDYTTSFRYILKNASPYRVEVIDQIFESDYVTDWILSLEEQMKYPPASATAFFMRCREFSLIVKEFTFTYVYRAHKGILKSAIQLPESSLDQMEAFREEYNAYLRDFAKWSTSVRAQAKIVLGDTPEFMMVLPYSSLDRVTKSFRKAKAADA